MRGAAGFFLCGLFILGAVPAHAATPVCTILTATLATGSNSKQVSQLQDFLRAEGYLSSASTGYFGSLTQSAVKNFQTKNGLAAVGSVGPMTRALIQKMSCTAAVQVQSAPPSANIPPAAIAPPAPPEPAMQSLPYASSNFSNWLGTWSDVSTTSDGALHLRGTLSANGAEAIFPGSLNWVNYEYTANVNVANGSVTLLARYADDNNYLVCTFSNNWVEIDQHVDGVVTMLDSAAILNMMPDNAGLINTTVAMRVQGNTVGCSGYGPSENVTYTIPGTPLQKGGIGIETWYNTPLAAQLDLLNVSVQPLN